MARVTTKTGDEGYTGLLGRERVPKNHPLIEAVGAIDEADSSLGLARAQLSNPHLQDMILQVQKTLYTMMAELTTPPENYAKVDWKITEQDVAGLETWLAELKEQVEIGKEFVVPGATVAGAALDVARTVVRRGERQVVALYLAHDIPNAQVMRYLNRLSDLLFVMARLEESQGA